MIDEIHTTARLNGPLFKSVSWTCFGIGTCFVAFRLYARRKTLNRFFNDDYLVLLGLLCFLLAATIQQVQLAHVYELYAVEAGKLAPSLPWMKGQTQLLHSIIGFNILFYTSLWSIKLSFMMFFRRLDGGFANHRLWWWIVLIIAICGWVASVADIQWYCSVYRVENNFARYMECGKPDKVRYQQATFHGNTAVDIGTDILILTIPISLLWKRRISWKKKILFMILFSMTVLIIAISIIRVTVVSTTDVPSDITWLFFWSNIEVTMALIVSSLASFRQLYVSSNLPERVTNQEKMDWAGKDQWGHKGVLNNEQGCIPSSITLNGATGSDNLQSGSNGSSNRAEIAVPGEMHRWV